MLSSPLRRAMYTAKAVQTFQTLAGHKPPQALQREELTNRDWGDWDGQPASEVASGTEQPMPWSASPARRVAVGPVRFPGRCAPLGGLGVGGRVLAGRMGADSWPDSRGRLMPRDGCTLAACLLGQL